MAASDWPSVGLHDPSRSITLHASHIRVDIENLHRQIGQGADAVPSEIFLKFSFSVLELVEKMLDQPSLEDVWNLVKQIDQNTRATLGTIKRSKEPENAKMSALREAKQGKPFDLEPDDAVDWGTKKSLNKMSYTGSITKSEERDATQIQERQTRHYLDPLGESEKEEEAAVPHGLLHAMPTDETSTGQTQEQQWMQNFGPLSESGDEDETRNPEHSAIIPPIEETSASQSQDQAWLHSFTGMVNEEGEEESNSLYDSPSIKPSLENLETVEHLDFHGIYEETLNTTVSVSDAASLAAEGSSGTKSSKLILPTQSLLEEDLHDRIYKPLDKGKNEIRVVRISPKADTDYDIRCDFSVISLEDKPVYRALSYTWGDAKDTLPIMLNGHRFQVTRNLKRALRRLRTVDTKTPIWIDAICINQIDMDERAHQVQLMRHIYESPTEVIVYLGEPQASQNKTVAQQVQDDASWDQNLFNWTADDSDISKIDAIMKYGQAYADTYPDLPDDRAANPLLLAMCFLRLLAGDVHLKDMLLLKNVNIQRECLRAFQGLVGQPWWDRIWCVQEVILPPTVVVIYGRFQAPLQMYADAAGNLERHQSTCCKEVLPPNEEQFAYLDEFTRKMTTIIESGRLWQDKAKTTLMTLLRLYYPKDATDPRDKIYGLLGLVREWGNARPIMPDYSISHARLFEEAAFSSIAMTNTLDFLAFKAAKIMERSQFMQNVDDIKQGLLYYTKLPPKPDVLLEYDWEHARKMGKPQPVPYDFSSWAPDWGRMNERGYESILAERINRALVFNASGDCPALPPKPLFTASPVITRSTILTVSAYRVGKVRDDFFDHRSYAMPFLVNDFVNIVCDDNFPLPLQPTKELMKPYISGGSRYDAICRAVCGDTFFNSTSKSASRARSQSMFRRATAQDIESVKLWRQWMRRIKEPYGLREVPSPKDFSSQEEYQRVLEADRAIRSVGLLRRFVELGSGYVGMVADARPEDEVMIFMGARTPFAVRSLGVMMIEGVGMRKVHVLVGECYLIGGMDGELVEQMKAQGNNPEELYLI